MSNSKETGVARWMEHREDDLGGPCSHSEAFGFDSEQPEGHYRRVTWTEVFRGSL